MHRFMRISFMLAIFFSLFSQLSSCEKSGKSAAADKPAARKEASNTALRPGPAPDVRLEDAGSGEKVALRYRFKAGDSITGRMDMKMSMKMELGPGQEASVDMPSIGMKMPIQAKEVRPNGNLVYEFSLGSVEVAEDASLPPNVLDNLKSALTGFNGTQGKAEVTPRGMTVNAEMQVPQDANPQIKQMVDSMRQQINQMSVPFPEEPVGVGARWKVTTKMDTGGIQVTNIYHYTLEKMENGNLEMKVTLEQTAEPQEVKNPSLPPGTVVKLTELASSGNGTIRTNLSQLVPQSEIVSEMKMKMHIQAGAQEQDMTQSLSLKVKIRPENP